MINLYHKFNQWKEEIPILNNYIFLHDLLQVLLWLASNQSHCTILTIIKNIVKLTCFLNLLILLKWCKVLINLEFCNISVTNCWSRIHQQKLICQL